MAKKRTKSRSQPVRNRQTPSVATRAARHEPAPRRARDARRSAQPRSPSPLLLVVAGVAVIGLVYLVAGGLGAGLLVSGILAATVYVVLKVREVAAGESALVAAQKAVVLALVFLMPAIIDPRTADVFATVKFTVLMVGTIVLLALFAVDRLTRPRPLRLTPVHAVVGFLVLWAVVSTLASGHVALSSLGFYSSNNGLFTYLALGVLFVVTADLVRPADARPLAEVLWYGAGGVVVLYGVLQLLDQAWPGHGLEPVHWPGGVGLRVFGTTGVWSTLGNPNHLGGLCAIILPVGIMLFLLSERVSERVVTGAIGAGCALIIGQTSSRGAWAATAIGLLIVAVLERRRVGTFVRQHPALTGAAGLVTAAAVAFSANSGLLSKGSASLFETGGSGTIAQRLQFWKTTLRMSAHAPVLGYGFDGYRLTWPRFMTRRFAETWDPELQVTGPHNTFFAHLYWGGWPALLALVLVVVALVVLIVRLHRRIAAEDATAALVPVMGVSAIAYLIVESFNVERVEFATLFWVLLAVVVAVARAHGLAGLRVAAGPGDAASAPAPARPRRARAQVSPVGAAASIVAGAVAVVALFFASAPWRADLLLGRAGRRNTESRALRSGNPDLANERAQQAVRDLDSSSKANPWEARYVRSRADRLKAAATAGLQQNRPAEQMASLLEQSIALYDKALALTPHDAYLIGARAEAMFRLASNTGEAARRDEAFAVLRREVAYAPYNGRLRAFFVQELAANDRLDEAAAQLDAGLRVSPDDTNLLKAAVVVYPAAGQRAKGAAAQKKLDAAGVSTTPTASTSSTSDATGG